MKEKGKLRLINVSPTLQALMILFGAGILSAHMFNGLELRVLQASGIFLCASLITTVFATLRAAQIGHIFGLMVNSVLAVGILVCLWMIGNAFESVSGLLYHFTLIATTAISVQFVVTLTGRGAIVDDGIFDEGKYGKFGQDRFNRRQRPKEKEEYSSWQDMTS